ncbi:unnamed protein product [Lactuca saligna]|uniref:Uncharacterized protein n=1 Tax=Lactuca saligna TaxID=75948 RepID=A0AA35Y9J2_LACSI|nr:unnamed protein product [Lactuca saligna]
MVEESPSKSVQEKKSSKSPKKKQTEEVVVSKPVEKAVELKSIEPYKEIVPSKYGVFKHKCVVLREVPILVCPSAKKRKAEDMAKYISKKQKRNLCKLVINDESTEEEVVRDPPVPNSPEKSTIETNVVSSQVSNQHQLLFLYL